MKQIDIYLGFTHCQGRCIFCNKGQNLVHFSRGEYINNSSEYEYKCFVTPVDAMNWATTDMSGVDRINISGNEPMEWRDLGVFMKLLRCKLDPKTQFTLRISNTIAISEDILLFFDFFELSLYGDNQKLHNLIVGNNRSWDFFHNNMAIIEKFKGKSAIRLQTILTRKNINVLNSTLEKIFSFDIGVLKIIYPHFFPKENIHELASRTEILKKLLATVDYSTLQKCILVNFQLSPYLSKFFYDVRK